MIGKKKVQPTSTAGARLQASSFVKQEKTQQSASKPQVKKAGVSNGVNDASNGAFGANTFGGSD